MILLLLLLVLLLLHDVDSNYLNELNPDRGAERGEIYKREMLMGAAQR
jgi:hypothetical protein